MLRATTKSCQARKPFLTYQSVSRRYRPVDTLWVGGRRPGEGEKIVAFIKKNRMGWDRSFTPEDQETVCREGGGGGRGMVFAPMQTGAKTGSDSAGGRTVTDNFSPRTPAPLPPLPCLGASSEAGQARADRGSRSPRVCAGVAR